MAICPICGCKTEELDFVERKTTGNCYKICSFCNRQLNVFDSVKEPTQAQLRWIDAVIGKDVPERSEELLSELKAVRSAFSEKTEQPPQLPYKNVQSAFDNGETEGLAMPDSLSNLEKRITALENELRAMKRKQMIKTIVELGVPFVLLILLLIIIASSGVMDDLKTVLDMAGVTL